MTQSQQVIEELYDCYTKSAANIISYFQGDERKEMLKELRSIVENNCKQRARLTLANDIKDRVYSLYDANDNTEEHIQNIMQNYKEGIENINVDVSNNKNLIEHDRQVAALLECDQSQDADTSASTELQMTGSCINVIDPISKKRITDPVKNTLCGHTYDRESVMAMLKMNSKTRCPVMGCKSKEFISISHLKRDIVVETYLQKNPA